MYDERTNRAAKMSLYICWCRQPAALHVSALACALGEYQQQWRRQGETGYCQRLTYLVDQFLGTPIDFGSPHNVSFALLSLIYLHPFCLVIVSRGR